MPRSPSDPSPTDSIPATTLLGNLLVSMVRGAIQYVGESWPWTDPSDQERQTVLREIIEEQRDDITRLVTELSLRGVPPEFGTYPDYSMLHYVALDRLLPVLIENQQAIREQISQTRTAVRTDRSLHNLLTDLHERADRQLRSLQKLAERSALDPS